VIVKRFVIIPFFFFSFLFSQSIRTSTVIDDGTSAARWTSFQSIGVGVTHREVDGAVRFDIDFPKGSGYGGIVRNFAQALPENYEISFMMKATVAPNNFEIKVSGDSSGENIWWVNNKNYTYPTDWKKIIIKKRHLSYAWGTKFSPFPPKLSRLEIVVTAGSGGKGSVWIDDVTLTALPTIPVVIPKPTVNASSFVKKSGVPSNILAGVKGMWRSRTAKSEWIELDLKYEKEFGAVNLVWDNSLQSVTYDVQSSFDGKNYQTLASVFNGKTGNVHHFLPESEGRFVRIVLKENGAKLPYALESFEVIASEQLATPNQLYEHIAASSPEGYYPRYFKKQQAYWTVVGVPSDTREALFSEEGAFEVDRQKFSLEPFIKLNSSKHLLTWSNAEISQSLEDRYLPIPTVERKYDGMLLRTTLIATGEPERSAVMARYIVKNTSSSRKQGSFFIAVRPFQVNPTSQWLNYDGGFAKTVSMKFNTAGAAIDDKTIAVSGTPSAFGATAIEQGDITEFLAVDAVPRTAEAEHPFGFTSGAFQYPFDLNAGDSLVVVAAVPFTNDGNRWKERQPTAEEFAAEATSVSSFWKKRLTTVEFTVNTEAQKYVDIIRSYLSYILINKDKNGFQPGSRSYERSWIRDGSMTSDALLKLGITEEPKKYLEWYSSYQYESGAVPCVVDTRGPDPVPEHDSHGRADLRLHGIFPLSLRIRRSSVHGGRRSSVR
jgi:hypothetical protein